MEIELKIGDKFDSYDAFDLKLKEYQKSHMTQFSTVNAERIHEDPVHEIFRYRVLRLQCKQGQKKESTVKDTSLRPNQRSYKVGCPVMLNLRLNTPKNQPPFLKITKLVLEHAGHDVTPETFNSYPEQRRIQPDEVDEAVLSAVTMKTAEKMSILETRHASVIMRQDIYNLKRRFGMGKGNGGRDDFKCEEILKDVRSKGGHAEVGRDENGDFLFAMFQTRLMIEMLKTYPECFIMDCNYNVNHYLYSLLTVMVLDGDGHGISVFHAFMAKEDRMNIMEQCLHVFAQQFNPSDAQCFIVDKDKAEIAAVSAIFPRVPVKLCRFHISQAVEQYLGKEIGRGAPIINVVLDSFMKQVNTESEEEFDRLKIEISNIVIQPCPQYPVPPVTSEIQPHP